MSWVLLDILVPLLVTFLIGLATGWLLWRWRRRKVSDKEIQSDFAQSSTAQVADLDDSVNVVLIEERDVAVARAEKAEGELESLKMGIDDTVFDSTPKQAESITSSNDEIADNTELAAIAAELEKERNARAEVELALSDLNSRYIPLQKLVEQDESLLGQADKDRSSEKLVADRESELSLLRRENERLQARLLSVAEKTDDSSSDNTDDDTVTGDSPDSHEKSGNIRKLSSYSADTEQSAANASRQNPADSSGSQAMPAAGSMQGNSVAATASVASARASELEVKEAAVKQPETVSEELVDQTVDRAIAEPAASKESNDAPESEADGEPSGESGSGTQPSGDEASETQNAGQNVTSINVASNKKQKNSAADSADSQSTSDKPNNEKNNDTELKAASEFVPKAWEIPDQPPKDSERDDLQAIKGIGPVLEKMLHETGIYFYRQIASLDESGVAELDGQIPQFSGRIARDNWVGQAQELMSADE